MPRDPFYILNEHIPVSRETFDRLKLYCDLLVKWQTKINLVSSGSIGEIWTRHFLDSLQLKKFIPENANSVLDFGTGAGFPGMVLAIAGVKNIFLVDSDAKKISFLREVSRVTKTDVDITHDRIEKIRSNNFSVILSRAVSPLDDLLQHASRFVSHETICLFPKGKNFATEIEDAKKNWRFSLDILPSVTDENAVILRISTLQPREDVYGKKSN